jgi:hypothetical protein
MPYSCDRIDKTLPLCGTPAENARSYAIDKMSAKQIREYTSAFLRQLKLDLAGVEGLIDYDPVEKWGMGAIIKVTKGYSESVEKAMIKKGYTFKNIGIGFSYYGNYYSRYLFKDDLK